MDKLTGRLFERRTGAALTVTVAVLTAAFLAPIALGQEATAIVGATIIDGNGGPPIQDGTIVVQGERITAVGPRSTVQVPSGARVIPGAGKFVTPGLIDTNVHMSLTFSQDETNARYWDRHEELVLQGGPAPAQVWDHDRAGQLRGAPPND